MKVILDVQSVAVKQLESAIWMYAYDYDEVAVHTIASAAFELFTKRLQQETILDDIRKRLKDKAYKEFIATWNKPYNYFKHGSFNHKPLDYIEYDESQVEYIIYLSAGANLMGPDKFQLSCSKIFITHFNVKHADALKDDMTKSKISELQKTHNLSLAELSSKETLRIWLKTIGHTFTNGSDSPFRDIDYD